LPLPDLGKLVIGRAIGADVRIDVPKISRRHAVLEVGSRISIRDLGSTNGTTVRGVRLRSGQSAEGSPGDAIELGEGVVVVLGMPRVQNGAEPQSMATSRRLIERVAPTNLNVLLLGETGVGKEVAAESIHRLSSRADGPFLALNCAAFSDNLIESELFGH